MPLFSRDALHAGVQPRAVSGWAMCDFASQGYATVVSTAVFNACLVSVMAGNAPWATLAADTWKACGSVQGQTTATGILPMRACHSRGPVWCTLVPWASTATVTGMSVTLNS